MVCTGRLTTLAHRNKHKSALYIKRSRPSCNTISLLYMQLCRLFITQPADRHTEQPIWYSSILRWSLCRPCPPADIAHFHPSTLYNLTGCQAPPSGRPAASTGRKPAGQPAASRPPRVAIKSTTASSTANSGHGTAITDISTTIGTHQ